MRRCRSLRIYYGDRARAAPWTIFTAHCCGVATWCSTSAHVGVVLPLPPLGAAWSPSGAAGVRESPQTDLDVVRYTIGRRRPSPRESKMMISRQPDGFDVSRNFVDAPACSRLGRELDQELARASDDARSLITGTERPPSSDRRQGFEAGALAGLTQPVKSLSFEFTTIQRATFTPASTRIALGYALQRPLGEIHCCMPTGSAAPRSPAGWPNCRGQFGILCALA